MNTTSIGHLARKASEVIREVELTGESTVITNRGVPVAMIVALDKGKIERAILAGATERNEGM